MNIYISGLNFSTTDADLNDLFSEYGEVSSARIITDRETRRSRGFGFVEMPDDAAGQKAIDELNGKELDGRAINVNLARPKEYRPRRDFGGNNDRGNGGGSFRQRSW